MQRFGAENPLIKAGKFISALSLSVATGCTVPAPTQEHPTSPPVTRPATMQEPQVTIEPTMIIASTPEPAAAPKPEEQQEEYPWHIVRLINSREFLEWIVTVPKTTHVVLYDYDPHGSGTQKDGPNVLGWVEETSGINVRGGPSKQTRKVKTIAPYTHVQGRYVVEIFDDANPENKQQWLAVDESFPVSVNYLHQYQNIDSVPRSVLDTAPPQALFYSAYFSAINDGQEQLINILYTPSNPKRYQLE